MRFSLLIESAANCVVEKNYPQAIRHYKEALILEPHNKKIYFNLGVCALHCGENYSAIEYLQSALTLDPSYYLAYTNLGIAYKKTEQYQKAIGSFQVVLAHNPNDIDTLYNLGNTYSGIEEYEKALECFGKVLRLDPLYYKCYHSIGLLYNHQMEYDKAYEYFQKTLALRPKYPDSIFALSLIALRRGDFVNGWRDYNARFEASNPLKQLTYPLPFWKGESLEGKRILIQEEQGYGDTIQFIRYVRMIHQRGVGKIYVAVRQELLRLFQTIDGVEVVTNEAILYDIDYVVSLLSLPHIFGTTLASIPQSIPYFGIEKEGKMSDLWGKNTKNKKIAFGFQGNKEHKNDRYRSIPLEILKDLFDTPLCDFYSFQMGASKEIEKLQKHYTNLYDATLFIDDFYDSAKLLLECDLVVTIDSALVHLSGALGISTLLLLPLNSEWRWLEKRDDSPWYPTVKIIHQKTLGLWREAIGEVKGELRSEKERVI